MNNHQNEILIFNAVMTMESKQQNGDGTQYITANSTSTVRIAPGEMQVLEIIRAENTNRQPLISDNIRIFHQHLTLAYRRIRPVRTCGVHRF